MNLPAPVADPVHSLTLQLLEWISDRPRSHAELLDAWRTSCPRLSIWEDACIAGLIESEPGAAHIVALSPKGRALLLTHRQHQANPNDPTADCRWSPARFDRPA
jgi:hypothetical protein